MVLAVGSEEIQNVIRELVPLLEVSLLEDMVVQWRAHLENHWFGG